MKIKIAEDFSRIPGARFPEEGNYSGQDFRNNILLPKLEKAMLNHEKLEIDLDGTAGLGTSFLEEAFGGLIRINRKNYDDIINTLFFISNDDTEYIEEILTYMKEANEKENK
jgi:hypothetical protein